MAWTGGCLCGAVRYKANETTDWASCCHCDMCRQASGAPFTGYVEFRPDDLQWTASEPAIYESSDGVVRRFCAKCGSPLTFEADGVLFITLGTLDQPERVTVRCHTYTDSRLPNIKLADGLPDYPGPVGGKGGRPLG